jgi:high-affinity iron transporter
LSVLGSSWLAGNDTSAILNITVLVFREGLECILVVAALTASFKGREAKYHRPVLLGLVAGALATLLTWAIAARILDDLATDVSALALQAGTGLVAIVVLLVVMNWFFHKVYWTGWISLHNQRKRRLLSEAPNTDRAWRITLGMAALGFTSFYREGFEVVLFLQGFRLRLGGRPVLQGVLVALALISAVAVLTFIVHRHLPYRKMLVATGVTLAAVLIVMVGEEVQEMQLAGWLPTTELLHLGKMIPNWAGQWLSVFPTAETLVAQGLAGGLVLGSYLTARHLPGMPN